MQTCVDVHDFGLKRRYPAVMGCFNHRVSSVNRSEFPVKICEKKHDIDNGILRLFSFHADYNKLSCWFNGRKAQPNELIPYLDSVSYTIVENNTLDPFGHLPVGWCQLAGNAGPSLILP